MWMGFHFVAFNVMVLMFYQNLMSQTGSATSLGSFYQAFVADHILQIFLVCLSTPCVAWFAGELLRPDHLSYTNEWKKLTPRFPRRKISRVRNPMSYLLSRVDVAGNSFAEKQDTSRFSQNEEQQILTSLNDISRELSDFHETASQRRLLEEDEAPTEQSNLG